MVLYQIDSVHPMKLTFSFTPVMQRMWPVESVDRPSPEWVKTADNSGFYILHLNSPDNAAAIAMPAAEGGIPEPNQELPHNHPMQFVLNFDPARDAHTFFPLLVTVGHTPEQSNQQATPHSLTLRLSAPAGATQEIYLRINDAKLRRKTIPLHSDGVSTPDQSLALQKVQVIFEPGVNPGNYVEKEVKLTW